MNNRRILPFQGWRLVLLQAIVVCSLVILVVRLAELQFGRAEQFTEDAEENRLQLVLNPAPRGWIYDRLGVPLAKNDPSYNVTITPAGLPDMPADILGVYNRLSALIDVPATRAVADAAGRTSERSLDELVTEGRGIAPYRAVVVATDIPREVAFRIMEEAQLMPGVAVSVASVREYPSGASTAHIIGYLGRIGPEEEMALRELGYDPAFDRIGYAGIEAYFEEELAGRRGTQTWVVDVAGQPLQLVEETKFTAGQSVQLTIDLELQRIAQDMLIQQINNINGAENYPVTQQGVVIAMDPRNGEILAMVSWPSYDNSRFARTIDVDYYFKQFEDPLRPLVNHAISALYPPGSVWKLITAVGVVEEDVIDPNQELYDPGQLVLPNEYAPLEKGRGQTFVCWLRPGGHKDVDLLRAIAWSCDVYFYQVGGGNPELGGSTLRQGGLGIYDLYRWATAFGIGSELGVELPGELSGRMPERQWKRRNYGESWSTGDTYNAAFGQGYVTVTPLQLLNSVSAIINGGTLYQPTVVQNLQDANRNVLRDFEPNVIRTIVPKAGEDVVLLLHEDMLVNGPTSLACRCEEDSDYYDEAMCNPENYRSNFDRDQNVDDDIVDLVQYTVHVPYGYTFNGSVCNELEFEDLGRNERYIPPLADPDTMTLVQQGMRQAVTIEGGTAIPAALTYVNVAGKTGTAEYCDDIAYPLGLCVQGQWPAHAWYVGYAPYENPEIAIIAFVYNGKEGSVNALPIVKEVMHGYFTLKSQRSQQ